MCLRAQIQRCKFLQPVDRLNGGSLQSAGLYEEVKAIFVSAARRLEKTDHARAVRLRSASPHWLRHGYAIQLVVDHQVLLPVVQALLGHASVQTTAGYAKTDLSQLRTFVDATFAPSDEQSRRHQHTAQRTQNPSRPAS